MSTPDKWAGIPGASRRQRVALLLVLVGLAAIFLLPFPAASFHPRLFNRLSNSAHLPILAGFTVLLYFLDFARRSLPRIGLVGFGAAIVVEGIQPIFGRSASWTDLLLGCLGVACSLAGFVAWRKGAHRSLRWVHGLATLGLVSVVLVPVFDEWGAIRWRERTFPVLSDFENERDLRLWEIRGGTRRAPSSIARSDVFASSGRHGLRVTLGDGPRAALWYRAGSRNWANHETLRFDIFNPGSPFRLGLRVTDGGSSWTAGVSYARQFTLDTGLNEFRVPLSEIRAGGREGMVDTTRIAILSLFPKIGEPPREYFLDNLRLE